MSRLPCPEVIEHRDAVPTEFAQWSVFAALPEPFAPTVPAASPPEPAAPSVMQWMAPHRQPSAPTVALQQLERFKALMNAEGWPVHLARMMFDRLYAYDRIVLAHTCVSFELRTLAAQLFDIFQQQRGH